MPIGTIYFYNQAGGFGVIVPENGDADAFVHATALIAAGMKTLHQGQRISYVMRRDARGQNCACNLSLIYEKPIDSALIPRDASHCDTERDVTSGAADGSAAVTG